MGSKPVQRSFRTHAMKFTSRYLKFCLMASESHTSKFEFLRLNLTHSSKFDILRLNLIMKEFQPILQSLKFFV